MTLRRVLGLLSPAISTLVLACDPQPPPDSDAATSPDAFAEVDDAGTDAAGPRTDVCDELMLPREELRTGTGTLPGEVAGDFTVQTLGGPWHMAEQWTGCDNHVFFNYFPNELGDALFGSLFTGSLLRSPRNVHYFFTSYEDDADARMTRMVGLAEQLEMAFNAVVPEESDREFWRSRMHFVTDRVIDIEGSPGAYMTDYLAFARDPAATVDLGDRGRVGLPYPFVFGIDRAQEWDSGDDLSPTVGQRPSLSMGQYLPRFYNYRHALDTRLETEEATIVPILDHERTTGRIFTRTVALPSAATMATVDSMEFDIEITCEHRNMFGCSEWDRIANVFLCLDGEPCLDRREVTRWITPYWRRGRQRYAIDASPFLGLVRGGGSQTFRVELGPEWERATEWIAHVALRFRARGGEPRSMGAVLAFQGGAFDAMYNMRMPFPFTVPASATRVELVTILSGHGQTMMDNCAEWCDHRHIFSVAGTELPAIAHEGAMVGSRAGCAEQADNGVIPGQGGNWAPTRAYWCPGLPVAAERTDITSLVTPGVETMLGYRATYSTIEPRGGDIALSAYVVWYE